MKHLLSALLWGFMGIGISAHAQEKEFIPINIPVYVCINEDVYSRDSLIVRNCKPHEVHKLLKAMQKAKDNSKRYFKWREVVESVQKTDLLPAIVSYKCDQCNRNAVMLYFCSPQWTWEKLCGRAGNLIICPHCMRQLWFHETVIS